MEVVPGTGGTQRCSAIIRHFEKAVPAGEGSVSLNLTGVAHGGNKCETGEMIMHDSPISNPTADIGRSNEIFKKFNKTSTGFWVGKSTRVCGAWTLPNPTAVYMAYEDTLTLYGPYDIPLPAKSKYIIFTNREFTCVYKTTSEPSPRPSSDEAGDNSFENSAETTKDPRDPPGVAAIPVTVLPSLDANDAESSAEPSAEAKEGESACFPEYATVELEDGSIKKMSAVAIGDRVRVGTNTFSDVFMFTHKMAQVKYDFVKIETASTSVSLTRGHYLYVNGALAAAITVKVGDYVEIDSGTSAIVMEVSTISGKGLYNPQTIHGDIIVNKIRASTYTTAVEPKMAASLLAPLRALYKVAGITTCMLHEGADNIAKVLPSGASAL